MGLSRPNSAGICSAFGAVALATVAATTATAFGGGFTLTPLVIQGDEIETGVLATSIESLDVNDNGDWMLEIATNAAADFNRVVMINGAIAFRKGFPVDEPAGATISSFDSVRMNGNGDAGWNLFLDGVPTSEDSGIFFNDTLLLQESGISQFDSGLTHPTFYIGFLEVRMTDSNRLFAVASVDDSAIPSTVDRVLAWFDYDAKSGTYDETVMWKEGDVLPGQTESVTDFSQSTETVSINNSGQAMFGVALTGPAATNGALYIDDMLVVQKGDESPIVGRTYTNIGTSTRLDLNAGGDWVFHANISGDGVSNVVVVSNDQIVAQRGTPAPGTLVDILHFGSGAPVCIDDDANVWWYAFLTGDTDFDQALYRNHEPLIRKGVEVQGHTFTSLAGSTSTGGITKGFAVSPNGKYMVFRGLLNSGQRAAFLLTLDDECRPGADRNGDGCVDGEDLTLALGQWDPKGEFGHGMGVGDANCDGLVDGEDLTLVLGGWTPDCR